MKKIIIGAFLCLIFFVLILYSFQLLANQKYSFIPIGDVFILTILVILVIFWILKVNTLNKGIEKGYCRPALAGFHGGCATGQYDVVV